LVQTALTDHHPIPPVFPQRITGAPGGTRTPGPQVRRRRPTPGERSRAPRVVDFVPPCAPLNRPSRHEVSTPTSVGRIATGAVPSGAPASRCSSTRSSSRRSWPGWNPAPTSAMRLDGRSGTQGRPRSRGTSSPQNPERNRLLTFWEGKRENAQGLTERQLGSESESRPLPERPGRDDPRSLQARVRPAKRTGAEGRRS
jgi:hypothetical protein